MAQQTINIGTTANDGTGDQLRDAFNKTNLNFDEIYNGDAPVVRRTAPATLDGAVGDVAGMVALSPTSLFLCTTDYVGVGTPVWLEINDANVDAHLADTTIHFTEANVDHANIQSIGLNTHAQIDTHIADTTIHVGQATPATSIGAAGDLAGMVRTDASYIYVCTVDYDGTTSIWARAAIVTW